MSFGSHDATAVSWDYGLRDVKVAASHPMSSILKVAASHPMSSILNVAASHPISSVLK